MIGPSRLVQRGWVEAWGVWFPQTLSPSAMLPLWHDGCRLFVAGEFGHLLQFGEPRRLDCQICPGLPVVSQGKGLGWVSFDSLVPTIGPGSVGVFWEGQLIELELARLKPFDFSPWLHGLWDDFLEGEPLARPAPGPELLPPPVFEVRRELREVPPASPELQILIETWKSPPLERPSNTFLARAREAWNKLRVALSPTHNQRYLSTMVELFESGDLSQALRYGIPLGSVPEEFLGQQLGLLSPRQTLSIQPLNAGQVGIAVEPQGVDYLKSLYRKAALRLIKENRIEEAVFVYAELLRDDHEAVRVLEQHAKYLTAARLAQARQHPPADQIRLLFLAGETEQALAVARQSGQYLQVYHELLHQKKPQQAADWLWEWGRYLRKGRRYGAALQLLWPQRHEHPEILEWVHLAIEAGGVDAGKAMALLLPEPQADPASKETVRSWLDDPDPAGHDRVVGLIEGLRGLSLTLNSRLLQDSAGMCARAVLKRAAAQSYDVNSAMLQDLVKRSRDPLLQCDLPALPQPPDQASTRWDVELSSSGAAPILDAAFLPDGRLLCAMGAAGLLVLNGRGKITARLPIAVERIVSPWEGDRYLLVSQRGGESNLVWLSAVSLKTRPWISARLENYAIHYDGHTWIVVVEGVLHQIDAHMPVWRSLARRPLGGPVQSLTLSTNKLGILLDPGPGSDWSAEFYSYPQLTLRQRLSRKPTSGAFCSAAEDWLLDFEVGAAGVAMLGHRLALTEAPHSAPFVIHGAIWSVMVIPTRRACLVWAVCRLGKDRPACFTLAGVVRVAIRLESNLLTMADDLGNCRVADLQRHLLIRNIQVNGN